MNQGQQNWYECAKINEDYHHENFERFHYKKNPHQSFLPKSANALVFFLLVMKITAYTHVYVVHGCNNHTKSELI